MTAAVAAGPDASWPAPAGSGVLVLAFASAPAERAVLEEWLQRRAPPGSAQVEVASDAAPLEQALANAHDDPWLVPVRVTWLPRERDGIRAVRPSDLLALTNPRRPGPRLQARILRQEPDRCRVVAAEPARLSDLRARFDRARSEEAFPAFVTRQARLALERAERSLLGMQYKVPRLVVEEIEASARFHELVATLAVELGRPQEVLAAEVGVPEPDGVLISAHRDDAGVRRHVLGHHRFPVRWPCLRCTVCLVTPRRSAICC